MNKNESMFSEYKYGFSDADISIFKTNRGLTRDIVKTISIRKKEPKWMLEYRLNALEEFYSIPMPTWGGDLSELNFEDLTYYVKSSKKTEKNWDEVPYEIKNTFEKLGIPDAEKKYLAGVSAQYESEVVYHNMKKKFEDIGIIFEDTDTALKNHEEIFRKYFSKSVKSSDNKFSALNSAVWSGGSFIYCPPNVSIESPLQAYFRINSEKMGQFERTLIIIDENSSINYVEGCTAPTYSASSLHAAVVEIFIKKNSRFRYTTIQNWSTNVYNLVTKRAIVEENGNMEWIDGNLGSKLTMKYPSCVLMGKGARGSTLSIALASENQFLDAGCKMIHLAPNTSSTVISKSMSRRGGKVNYRGWIKFGENSDGSRSNIECDTIILDELSTSDTIPYNDIKNPNISLEHEATVSKISEEQLFYLMSRGINKIKATEMIVMGFIEPFSKKLPMEYAVELNRLISFQMKDSIG